MDVAVWPNLQGMLGSEELTAARSPKLSRIQKRIQGQLVSGFKTSANRILNMGERYAIFYENPGFAFIN
jgi:hypothetical protein